MDSQQRAATLLAILLSISSFVVLAVNAPRIVTPNFRVTAELDKLITPGVHRVHLTVYSYEQESPITSLSARLSYSQHLILWSGGSINQQYYSYEDFPEVTSIKPMSFGDHVTKGIWEGGGWGFDSEILLIYTLANGEKLDVETKIDWIS